MNPGCTSLLGESGDFTFDLLAVCEHQVGKFVDDANNEGPCFKRLLDRIVGCLCRIGDRLAVFGCPADLLVIVVEMTHPQAAHHSIAPIHFTGEPLER